MNPQLVNEHGPVRVELIVADTRGKHDQGARVVDRHPRRLADNLAVDPRPERGGSVGIAGLEHEGLVDLRVDPLVAELGSIQVQRVARDERAAGQQRADEVLRRRVVLVPGEPANLRALTGVVKSPGVRVGVGDHSQRRPVSNGARRCAPAWPAGGRRRAG
jgi:hypothetical protein